MAKFHYERLKRTSEKRSTYATMKITGVVLILMTLFISYNTIHIMISGK